MKFRQLLECNMGNIFLEKSYQKYGEETIPRLFSKNQNQEYLWIDSLKSSTICFFECQV